MKKLINNIIKSIILFLIGGIVYFIIENLYRGFSHWTMFLLGGICFLIIGFINEFLSWETPLWKQSLLGGIIITVLEFNVGCVVNIGLGWNVWNYDKFHLYHQICIPFFFVWCLLAIVAIVLDDYIRYWLFHEEKPHYVIYK